MRNHWAHPERVLLANAFSPVAIGERPDGGIVFGYWDNVPQLPGMLPPLIYGDYCLP